MGPVGCFSHWAAKLRDKKVASASGLARLAGMSGRGMGCFPTLGPPAAPSYESPPQPSTKAHSLNRELPVCGRLVLLLLLSGDHPCHCGTIPNVIHSITYELVNI